MKAFGLPLLVFFLLLQPKVKAQAVGYDAQDNLNALGANNVNGMVRKFDRRYEGLIGTPFLYNHWHKGSVVMKNGRKIDNLDLKIDLFNHDVIIRRPSGDSIILFANNIEQVLLNNSTINKDHLFKKISSLKNEAPGPKDALVEVLYEGKNTLLAERKKTIIKANYTGAYSTGKTYDEFRDQSIYYLKRPNKDLIIIKLNKRSVLDALQGHQSRLKSYIAQENIDFKNEIEVVKVVKYYDSL